MPTAEGPAIPPPRGLIAAFAVIIVAIIFCGSILYSSQEQQITDQVTNDLTAISGLKAKEIASWREDRMYDARVISSSPFFTRGAEDYFTSGSKESRDGILTRFQEKTASGQYTNVLLVDSQGKVRISLDPSVENIPPVAKEGVERSLATGNITLTDLDRDPATGQIQLFVIAPLIKRNGTSPVPVGTVLLSLDPAAYLYPYIQSWPVPSRSAESLLVERRGDNVLFLNNLRHMENSAMNLTIPLTSKEVPAVMAVHGRTGAFIGKDYRDTDVISVIEPVPDSPWYLVTKVDTAEAFAAWRMRSGLIIVLIAGIVGTTIIIVGLIWQRRQKYYYRNLYAAEVARSGEEERNRDRLEVLTQLSRMDTAKEPELTDYVLDAAERLTGSPFAFIGIMSADENVLEITAWSRNVMKECEVPSQPVHLPVEKGGIWAEAVRTRRAVLVNDYTASHPAKKGLPKGHIPIRRFISLPVLDNGKVVMVSAVANKESDYTQSDIDHLALLMQGVWVHIRKRRADEDLHRKTTELKVAFEEIAASEEELRSSYEELANSQLALSESERKYRNLYLYAQVGLFETDLRDATVIACNQYYADLAGFPSVEDAIGKDVLGLYASPGDRSEISRILREQGHIDNFVTKFRNRSTGREFWARFSARYNEQKDAAEGTIIDITTQKETEDALRQSEEKFSIAFRSSPYVIIITRLPGGEIMEVNRAFEQVTGYTVHEVLGKTTVELNLWETAADRQNVMEDLQGKNPVHSRVLRFRKKDRTLITGLYSAELIRLGNTTCVLSSLNDISDRQQILESLKESEEKYRLLFTRMNEGCALHEIMYDHNGLPTDYRIIDVNPAFETIFEVKREQVIGRTSREAYHVTNPPYLDVFAGVTGTGSPVAFETFFAPMGRHLAIAAFMTRKGRFATIFEDITERKRSEDLREHLIHELEQKNANLEQFTFTVSHDLKNPLITIRSYAGMIDEDLRTGDPHRLQADLSRIIDAASTLEARLSDLLELSWAGKRIQPSQPVQFGVIVRESLDLLAGPLAERRIRVVTSPEFPLVNVDPARIREVLVILIENAIKFSGDRPDPEIRICVDHDGEVPVFLIRDNGIGINPRYLGRIFNLFEQLGPSRSGTGIGLPIARRIIEAHGGRIWAESDGEGKGTTIRFTLPDEYSGTDTNNNWQKKE